MVISSSYYRSFEHESYRGDYLILYIYIHINTKICGCPATTLNPCQVFWLSSQHRLSKPSTRLSSHEKQASHVAISSRIVCFSRKTTCQKSIENSICKLSNKADSLEKTVFHRRLIVLKVQLLLIFFNGGAYGQDQSVPRETSTASARSQCSPPDPNSEPRVRVFPAGPPPQAQDQSVPRRASTTKNLRRYAR